VTPAIAPPSPISIPNVEELRDAGEGSGSMVGSSDRGTRNRSITTSRLMPSTAARLSVLA